MPRYFLTKLAIEGFRGINNEGDPLELKFKPASVNSVFATNGIGKSSLFDALSYAIRGNIQKLDDMQAQENPGAYYCNRFHSQGKATIDLEFTADDTHASVISIRVERDGSGQRVVTSPSGHTDPESFLATLNENFTLLDYRTFARFIEDSPLDRGRSFSALLGLSAYSDARQAFQTACDTRTFNTDFEIKAITAELTAADNASKQALATMRVNYERVTGKPFEDVTKIDAYATEVVTALGSVALLTDLFKEKTLNQIDFDVVKDAVRKAEGGEERRNLERTIEAMTRLEALGIEDVAKSATEQQSVLSLIDVRDRLLTETRGDLFKRLYQATTELYSQGTHADEKTCPLCNTSPLENSIKDHAQKQLEQYRKVTEQITAIKELCQSAEWIRRIAQLERTELLNIETANQVASTLSAKTTSGEITRDEVISAFARLKELEAIVAKSLDDLKVKKAEIEKTLPESLVQLTEQIEYGRQFHESWVTYIQQQRAAASVKDRLDIRERWKQFINAAGTTFSDAEGAMSKAKIASIDAEYKAMFKEIMNVGDIVPELRRAEDREDLHVQLGEFHGQRDLSARALLSESYRNALAISVFLAAALKHNGSPRFVVLDDVTSSFDAGHQFNLMEVIRLKLQQPHNAAGLQFVLLSHDGLLEKYFDRLGSEVDDWHHNRLQGSPPMGAVLNQSQTPDRLRDTITTFLSAGQTTQAEPLIRQYLEFKLQEIIRRVKIPVPIDFVIKDHTRMVQNCIDAIRDGVDLEKRARSLVLDAAQEQQFTTVHVPAILGNWASHYATGSTSSLSARMLQSVVQTIDDLAECFRFDDSSGGSINRKWYKSLSRKI
jgi:ABC-type hemin transport system ATPase subunit